ncbi:snRNA-activating protein complex subunit 1-like isoform X4 [Ceratina calcarata]|uniref:snRNA-activating protein complex subunit 1-like isoform X4 n=1 Tax=Ceratina calcarata TaxID=156304 RepID=A0AAJ7J537_9HYME|nr:snRNA-activating protein complex subunit 1-like isoform X4 [Ceratina calcarata]XP_026671881.1 snRNA-activating protein complex subunit 1-like isoform X4 [Ceratina calcarata]
MTYETMVTRGFKEDCERLITRFERADDIRFETFCEIWKEMKFSLVFTGRSCFLELLEFCEEALDVCKQFLLLPPRFKERIGGLYLLYGIYYKMPIDQFKIRMKLEDWRIVMDLHAEIREAEHLDANYVLCKLITDNAFHFCIFESEFGLEKHYRRKNLKCFNPYSMLPRLKDLTDKNQILADIDELSKTYEKMKEELRHRDDESTIGLNLYNSNIVEEITNDIREFEEERRSRQTKTVIDTEKTAVASTSKAGLKRVRIGGPRNKVKSLVHNTSLTRLDAFDEEDDDEDEDLDTDVLELDEFEDSDISEDSG